MKSQRPANASSKTESKRDIESQRQSGKLETKKASLPSVQVLRSLTSFEDVCEALDPDHVDPDYDRYDDGSC